MHGRKAVGHTATAQARAALAGRDVVLPDDVKAVAPAALAHRLILRWGAASGRSPAEELVQALLDRDGEAVGSTLPLRPDEGLVVELAGWRP